MENGKTWEYAFFLDDFRYNELPYDKFREVLDYDDSYYLRRFQLASEEQSKALFSHFNLAEGTTAQPFDEDDYEEAVGEVDDNEELDKKYEASRRVEQKYLRDRLLGSSKTGVCGVCSSEYPTTLLVAGHIKKRSACSREEKLDVDNIAMPFCKFGCDELFERGIIGIENGKVVQLDGNNLTKPVEVYLNGIVGNDCAYFTESNGKYFEWHLDEHRD